MPLVTNFRAMLLAKKEKQEHYRKLCGRSYCKEYLNYIFVNEMGERWKPRYLSDGFKRILEQNGLRRIRFHDLRHTCASLLLANNVPMKKIQEWLGHSDFSTTANIYAHLDFQSKISSAEAMLTGLGMSWRITSSLLNNEKILTKPILSGFLLYGGELGIRTLGGFTLTAFRVLSVEHHFEENKGRTEKLREDKNTNNSSIFRLFSVKNRGVSRVRMNHANLLKNGHFGEI